MDCHYCGAADDLRPYGPGGAAVCFACAMATPERKRAAERAYSVQAEAAGIVGGGVITIGTSDGPTPGHPDPIQGSEGGD
ncbi:hypothetical protein LCGC14_2790840 [marine sediment metagenome]|uniref:Uncharacterized protein n=1 Tax=marine sediment metagenome TaxID=412755 RepID=A0A0F9BGX7_9ZZZZ